MGEQGLPSRTIAALIAITAVGLSWAVFAAWTLTHRRALLAKQRLIASYMAVAFSALFTTGAAAVGWSTQMEASWLAAGTGLVMLGVAGAVLMRARRRVAELRSRRAELERRISAVLVGVLLAVAPFPASSQQPGTPNPRADRGTFQMADAEVAVELGSFVVPANRTRAAGGMLTLRVRALPFHRSGPRTSYRLPRWGPGRRSDPRIPGDADCDPRLPAGFGGRDRL
jgi:hypothetical protein